MVVGLSQEQNFTGKGTDSEAGMQGPKGKPAKGAKGSLGTLYQ